MDQLERYFIQFDKMRRAKCEGIIAPHKPILLLTILDLIRSGEITSNKITLSDSLINGFNRKWKEFIDNGTNKKTYVIADCLTMEIGKRFPFKCTIANPYYHLQTEPFWKLHKSEKYAKASSYSIKALKENFEYAEIDDELFQLMNDENSSESMRHHLLNLL